ncbi:MAG: WbqC family protein [Xanthomonadales bacterium]|nr:WbqC family protein [Gammaproteobacteria bacterium]MBT8056353.1 WbqC family protein [Gammaproteobacteria bacterium]NNL04412.1 WbqC family protein [Xanthomonadales bacterium]
MKTAILQSNYIPWKGYFHLIDSVDTFVLYDSVQFTKNDWRNRNKIIINGSANWITIPVQHLSLSQTIRDTKVAQPNWATKHWRTIQQSYSKAPFFKEFGQTIEATYLKLEKQTHLGKINLTLIRLICEILEIKTKIVTDEEFDLPEDRLERLITICEETGASTYFSGPAARDYIDEDRFQDSGIEVEWMDYTGYPEYRQLSADFDHYVSILDLLFCYGPNFKKYIGSN